MNKLINDYENLKIEFEKQKLQLNRQTHDIIRKEGIIDGLEKRFDNFFFEEKLNTLKLLNNNIMLEKTIFLLEKQIKDQEENIQNERLNIINLTNVNKILTDKISILENQLKVRKKTEKNENHIYKNFFRY